MNALEVIVIGIGVVFLTLGILTLSTYLLGWIINRYFEEEEEDEKKRVAAIAAAIQGRGVR